MKKAILISIDGMRPDGFLASGNPFVKEMMARGAYTLKGRTVYPSVTLPCHMSMFHSVPPERHGILSNTYTPLVRPLNGLCEQIKEAGGKCGMFYGWEPLRDITRPESLKYAGFLNAMLEEDTDTQIADFAIDCLRRKKPDFVFLYMVQTDEWGGHGHGWMSPEYLHFISAALDNVKRVLDEFGEEYSIVVTADHGGHDRGHGSDMPEDMTIPLFFFGKDFTPGKELENVSILDIAPTVADLMDVPAAAEWEGKSLKGE